MDVLSLGLASRSNTCILAAKFLTSWCSRMPPGRMCVNFPRLTQWRVIYASSNVAGCYNRSVVAWSYAHSKTMPFQKALNGNVNCNVGLTLRQKPDGNFARFYSIRPLKDRSERNHCLGQESVGFSNKTEDNKSTAKMVDYDNSDVKKCEKSSAEQSAADPDIAPTDTGTEEKVGLMKRFKMMYKQYGVVLVCVHAFTASIWVSMFYCATVSGVDVVPLLRWLGASDAVVSPFLVPGVGKAAVIYLMYKLATPARYTVTIFGTQLAVKLLRRYGYMKVPETVHGKPDSLRLIVSDGRAKVKDKMEDFRDDVHEFKSKFRNQMNRPNVPKQQKK